LDVYELPEDAGVLFERKKLLQAPEMAYPHLADFESRLQPASGAFVLISMAPRPQGGYNTDLVSAGDLPTSYEEMTDPKWKGKVVMSSSGGGDPGRMAWLWREGGELGWDRSFDFFNKLGEQEPAFQRGYTSGAEAVAAGDDGKAMFWMCSPGRFSEMKIQGEPVDLLAFSGIPARFSSVGILKGAPNPNAAWLFIDYLTSPEGQLEFTDFIAPELPLNSKAQPGMLGGIVADSGGTIANTEAASSDFVLDEMAKAIFTDEALKKSADFYASIGG
jgi:iron(III) transport system substrate-binding protein